MENGNTPTFHSVLRIQIDEMWMRLYEMRLLMYKMQIRIQRHNTISLRSSVKYFYYVRKIWVLDGGSEALKTL